jgi:hypothetical protein
MRGWTGVRPQEAREQAVSEANLAGRDSLAFQKVQSSQW